MSYNVLDDLFLDEDVRPLCYPIIGLHLFLETQEFAANHFIDWKFNVACAPWWGGMWERLVSCIERCLKKTIGTKQLSYVELQTFILEIEGILNNRPLCADYDDDTEGVLTPNYLVFS